MRYLLPLFALLAACGDDGDKVSRSDPVSGWAVGAPEARAIIGNSFPIPEQGSINYVTQRTGSLEGKTRITLRYRIDMAEGVQIVPASVPEQVSIITLYVQREGDDWSGKGDYNFYRWYATSTSQMPITAGEHVLTAHLVDDKWTAINAGESYITDPATNIRYRAGRFEEALAKASRVGFVLGGGTGYGHGVKATGPATLTVISYTVE